MTLRKLMGLDEKLGKEPVGPPRLQARRADECLEARRYGPSSDKAGFDDLAEDIRRKTGGVLVGWCRRTRAQGRLDPDYENPVVNPPKEETLDWRADDQLVFVAPPTEFSMVSPFASGSLLACGASEQARRGTRGGGGVDVAASA